MYNAFQTESQTPALLLGCLRLQTHKLGNCCSSSLPDSSTVLYCGTTPTKQLCIYIRTCVCVRVCVYLVNEEEQRLSEATVFLCQVAIPPFLLFQDLPLALPQVQHVLTVLLNTHVHTQTQTHTRTKMNCFDVFVRM